MKPRWPVAVPQGSERDVLTQVAKDTHTLLDGKLTIVDNMLAAYQEEDLAHGTEVLIRNPLPCAIKDIQAVAALNDTTTPLPTLRWYQRTDGLIAITAYYPLPETFIEVQATGSQTLGTGYTVVNYAATPVRDVGDAFTYDSTAGVSTITTAVAGLYDVRGFLPFNTGAASAHNIKIEASGTVLAISELQSQTYYTAVVSRNYYAAAGTAFRMLGACAGGTRGTYSPYAWLSVRQLERATDFTKTVRLRIHGG